MATTFADIYEYNTDNGVIVPDTKTVQDSVESAMTSIFGDAVDCRPETPLGRLVEALTLMIWSFISINAKNANQMNPNMASGTYLDAIAALFNMTRKGATYTTTKVDVVMSDGYSEDVLSTKGIILSSPDTGGVFRFADDYITLLQSGNTKIATGVDVVAISPGPIECEHNTLNEVATAGTSIQSVTNGEYSITIGTYEEEDSALRERIIAGVRSGSGSVGAIRNAVLACDDSITSCNVLENGYPYQRPINGVGVPGHSIFVCVEFNAIGGGSSTEINNKIANAIYETKTAGCNTKCERGGEIRTTVENTQIYFYSPDEKQIYVKITAKPVSYYGGNIRSNMLSVIEAYINSIPIGGTIESYGLTREIQNSMQGLVVVDCTFAIPPASGDPQWKTSMSANGDVKFSFDKTSGELILTII